jgi:hypothetical protein
MNSLSFVLDVGSITAWGREDLTTSVMRQAHEQDIVCDAEIRGSEMTVELRGPVYGYLLAFEAAIKSWVNNHE